jgi:predicted amidohydrolase YtcJ
MSATSNGKADLVLFNGKVKTLAPDLPSAQAVACAGGRIVAVGESDRILSLSGPGTEKIDLAGRLLVPGFTDAHIHFYEWALKRQHLNLAGLSSLQELIGMLKAAAFAAPADRWILGQGWNETDWREPQMPTREILDAAVPDHPVLLWRCDLHLAAANSAALASAGIGRETEDPPGGRIERGEDGRPNGIVRELAINRLRDSIPGPSAPEVKSAYVDGISALHRLGITGIHDIRLMNDPDGQAAQRGFSALHRDGRLDLRCWVTLPNHRLSESIANGLRTGAGDDRLRIGHVKFFFDGGVGARTAWMTEPFLDAGLGMAMATVEELSDAIARAEAAGISAMVHAVGDRANRELIDLYAALARRRDPSKPGPPIPHRIEHAQVIRPEDAARLSGMNLAVSVTPPNMILDINLIDTALGDRGRWAYPFRSLIDSGAPVMFSSDCPVCDPNPMVGIHAAVTRQREDGTPAGGWYPKQRVTVEEAVRAYTLAPAAAHGQDRDLGSVSVGRYADLAVLSEDLFAMEPARIAGVKVDLTVFDGKVVSRRE